MKPMGRTTWVIPGGHIPLYSTGHEPDYTSHDKLCVLNVADEEARLEIVIYYTDREPAGPYQVTVPARRTLHIRFNDLIDPEAIFLDVDYASVVTSNIPVVVQFSRLDSTQAANAIFSTIAWSE
jgi:hypothetical protein